MEKNYVMVNIGSASKKYALYRGGREVFRAHFEHEGEGVIATINRGSACISVDEYENSFAYILPHLGVIHTVGVRIVAPGEYFQEHREITSEYIRELTQARESAPLHITPVLKELAKIRALLPGVQVVGVSDSCFHKQLPDRARRYGINVLDTESLGIVRYGYHGISLASIMERVGDREGGVPPHVVVCHLGGGASVTAIDHGQSIDTSMGFTPLEGLLMASRSGDIDPGALIYLAKKRGLTLDQTEEYLNHNAGLRGVSGVSDDIRVLLDEELKGNIHARQALDLYTYRIAKYIGAYSVALGGLDMVVFAGTVGERSPRIRERIGAYLKVLGVELHKERNEATVSKESFIQSDSSHVRVLVLKTDEMREMFSIVTKISSSGIL